MSRNGVSGRIIRRALTGTCQFAASGARQIVSFHFPRSRYIRYYTQFFFFFWLPLKTRCVPCIASTWGGVKFYITFSMCRIDFSRRVEIYQQYTRCVDTRANRPSTRASCGGKKRFATAFVARLTLTIIFNFAIYSYRRTETFWQHDFICRNSSIKFYLESLLPLRAIFLEFLSVGSTWKKKFFNPLTFSAAVSLLRSLSSYVSRFREISEWARNE